MLSSADWPKPVAELNAIIMIAKYSRIERNKDYLFTGAPVFTGVPDSGCGSTFPLIRTTFVGSFTALEVIVTLLLIAPGRLVSYFTVIVPVLPGAIGSFGHEGTVHPHDPFAFEMIYGSVPVFLKVKVHVPFPPNSTSP